MNYAKLQEMDNCLICSRNDALQRISIKSRVFEDGWGEIWLRVCRNHVHRYSDGNIGGWFKGQGLVTA